MAIVGATCSEKGASRGHAGPAARFLVVQCRKPKERPASLFIDILREDHSVVRIALSTKYSIFRVRLGRLIEVPISM